MRQELPKCANHSPTAKHSELFSRLKTVCDQMLCDWRDTRCLSPELHLWTKLSKLVFYVKFLVQRVGWRSEEEERRVGLGAGGGEAEQL